ncbi:MAG: NF038122 family metalloprotease [Phycisphaerales bacterium]|nr:NF038122 family metalloprotease [Phycisphaerales bacterium]
MNTNQKLSNQRLTRAAQLAALGVIFPIHTLASSTVESEAIAYNPVDNARIVGSAEEPMLVVPMQVPGWADELGVTKAERVYKGICGPNGAHASVLDLFRHADRDLQQMNNPLRGTTSELVGESPAFNMSYDTQDITLVAFYLPTIRRAINYIDSSIDNRVEIGATLALFDFSSDADPDNDDVIGSAGSARFTIPWSVYVEGLRSQSLRDDPDFANALPSSSVNVLYNGSTSSSVETEVVVTMAQLRAIFGDTVVPQGQAVSITFNSSIGWNFFGCDIDPVGSQSSLIDVAVHEFTHAMGFTSGIAEGGNNSNNQIQGLDVARFRAGNLPFSLAAFGTNPRLGESFTAEPHFYSSFPNAFTTTLESGDDNQPSHLIYIANFADKLGVMDPVLTNGHTHCPSFYTNADIQPLDDMGWRPIIANGFQDCNGNVIPDFVDILNGTSQDVDNDLIPDECETFTAGSPNPTSGIQGVTRTIYETPGLASLASFNPNGSGVNTIVSDTLPTMLSFYNHGTNATRVSVFEFEMFIPARDEFAFRIAHPDDMDLMIDGTLIGSSTTGGSLTRSTGSSGNSTILSKQMFAQLDAGWHTVRIRGLSSNSQPTFDFIREARSLDWQQPPTNNLRVLNWSDCDNNGTNDFLDEESDFNFNNLTSVGTIADAFEPITFSTCGSNFDTEIVIWDLFGDVVTQNDDFCGPAPARQSQVDVNLPAGQYIVGITGYNAVFGSGFSVDRPSGCAEGGDYEFHITAPVGNYNESNTLGSSRTRILTFFVGEADCDNDGIPDDQELDCDGNGIPDDCEIPTVADADNNDIGTVGNEGEIITITTCGSDFDTEIAVWDESGLLVDENDDFCGPGFGLQSQLDLMLDEGVYYVAVAGYNAIFSNGFGIQINAGGNCSEGGILDISVGSYVDNNQTVPPGRVGFARFHVGPAAGCAADFTGDGTLDVFDVFAFLNAFNTGDPSADFTGDGSFDIFDVFAYLDAFNAGCP